MLYELLTGAMAFDGEDVTEILGAVVKTDPDWTKLPAATPPAIRTLLKRCLRKNPKERLDSAAAARLEIADVMSGAAETPARSSELPPRRTGRLAWAVAAAFALVAAGLGPRCWARSRASR